MPEKLTQNLIARLAFVKLLFNDAIEYSYKPEPMCWISILMLHDAIELFLHLSVDFLQINIKDSFKKSVHQINFMDYWTLIPNLKCQTTMNSLNEERVGLKHHFKNPNIMSIETHRINAISFFEGNTKMIFDIEFYELSLADLIKDEVLKNNIKKAEKYIGDKDYAEAINTLKSSFDDMITNSISIINSYFSDQPLKFIKPSSICSYEDRDIYKDLIKGLGLDSVEKVFQILGLGIDIKRYMIFQMITPRITKYCHKRGIETVFSYPALNGSSIIKYNMREKSYQDSIFCLNFVIECYLKTAELISNVCTTTP